VSQETAIVNMDRTPAASGDRLEDLYVRYAPGGFRLALLLTGDRQMAEDCVHDAFVRIVGRLGHVRSGLSFDAYLRRTIVNLTKNSWRRRALERTHAATPLTTDHGVPADDTAILERLRIWRLILRLPIRQRIAIVLRFYEDLPEDDIAAIMRCRPGTARSLVSRGMATLRAELEGSDDA
jgi:RNA polymerase sigma factor (sigma-70 family)